MAQFVISYFGGEHPESDDQKQAHFAKYQAWLAELGEVVVTPMVPFKSTRVISPNGSITQGSQVALMGHTVIQAESMEQAIELTKSCPFLDINGTLEVSEVANLPN